MKVLINLISVSLLSVIIFSCSPSTQLANLYVDEAYKGLQIKKVLVVGMAKEEWKRKVYENEFRQQLMKHNVEVLTAWQELPKGEQISKETFDKYFSDKNIDAVFVVISAGSKTETTMSRGGSSNVYVGFYGFYASTASFYYSPRTTSEEKIVYMKTNIYETSEGILIWSAKSQSYEPQNTGDVIKTVSYNVVSELNMQGYIK
ncbi:MAG: hypothetical protein OEM46_04315 [Ignavibacteria bacterium]|nr:hypothetical protein [Ignavibacteria bacterium]